MRRVFATPQDAELAFYDALERSDLEAMMEVWSEDEEIICIHPGQPRLVGYDIVRESWQRIFQSGQRLKVRIAAAVQMTSGMIAIHNAQEHLRVPDDRTGAMSLATNVFVRGAHGWRMIVHHASPAPVPAQVEAAPAASKVLH